MAKKRGRPREFDEQEARSTIMRTFWAKGYAGTSLTELSTATQLVRPSLSGAFGSKLDMFCMSMDVFFEEMAPAREATLTACSVEQALERFYNRALDVYVGDGETEQLGCFLIGTALTEAPYNEEVRKALVERLQYIRAMVEAILAEKSPGAEQEVIAFAADQAVATLHSLSVRARTGEREADLRAFAGRSARFIASSLEGTPPA